MINLTKTKSMLAITAFLASLFLVAPSYAAEDPSETCASAASLFKKGDIEGALEEARWCVTQLEQLKQNQTSAYFKDEINGFKGGRLESQNMMGFSTVGRPYSKGSKSVQVSLAGGASGGANNALAALASFGMQAATGKRLRIQRRSAVLNDDSGTINLVVTLKSGGVLTFDSNDLSEDGLVAFAKAFPVADLDDSRK